MGQNDAIIRNPILPGFNPDPSIVRVGEDYYVATSTFEWYPGVQIHHSRDLVHWRLLTRPLARASQLNMLGDPDSCGVWAPVPDACRRPLPSRVHRRQALRPHDGRRCVGRLAPRLPQLPGDQPADRRRVERSGASEQQRLRPLAVPRRRRAEVRGEHALGSPAREESLCRHRLAGVLTRGASSPGRAPPDLRGDAHRVHRGATPLQARRLLLPADRRGRHRLGARGDHGPVARADGAVRAAPRHLHPDRASPARRRAAARRPRRPRGDARRPDLHRVPVRPAHPEPGTLHARPRDRDPADDVGHRRLAAHRGRRWAAGAVRSGAWAPRAPVPRCAGARGLRRPGSADRLPVAALAVARGAVQPHRAPGTPAAVRPRNAGQPVPAGAGRAATAGTLLQRVHGDGMRAGALPADGGPHLLLRRHEVPLPLRVTRRRARSVPARDVRAAGLAGRRRVHGPDRDSARADRTAGGGGFRAPPLRVSRGGRRSGPGSRRCSTPASSPTRRPRRGCRTSPARSSGWRATIWRARRFRRTSTGSSTGSASTAPDPA